ncbi:MAG: hypothetical protein IJ482_04630 [Alphaproteobacteria bacterium]|nr:hypothetical protein [Alphaproteobacteria bacterium]
MSEILFEYVRQGQYVKVTAIEPETRIEVSVVVPASLNREQMQLQALNRLNYVLRKKAGEE